MSQEVRTIVLFESPYRLLACLEDIQSILGPGRRICVLRELTKKFEEVLRGEVADILTNLGKRKSIKGEITLIIEGQTSKGS